MKPIQLNWKARQKAIFWPALLGLLLAFAFLQSARAMSNIQEVPPDPNDPNAPQSSLAIETVVDTPRDNNLVQPGSPLTYSVHYTNTTGAAISNVTISCTLSDSYAWDPVTKYPPDLQTYDGNYTSNPSIPANQFTKTGPSSMQWVLPSLGPNASGEIIFHTMVLTRPEPTATKTPIFIGNAIKIFSTQVGITGNQDDTVAVLAGPILELDKVVNPNPVFPGRILVYTMTVANLTRQDSIPATNLVITDVLPVNTTFLDAQQGGTYNDTTKAIVWRPSNPLPPGQSIKLNFRVLVSIAAPSYSSIVNPRAGYKATSREIKVDPVIGKNDAVSIVSPLLQKKAVAKTMVNNVPEVFPTEEVTYTITIHNPLNQPLTNVALTDTLPGLPGPFTYLRPAFGDPAPQLLNGGRDLAWRVDLPAWGSVTRSFVVQIPRNTFIDPNAILKEYVNTLNAYHPQAAYKKEYNLALVRVKAAMSMDKRVSNLRPQPGVTIYYTITLKNLAPFPINSIRLTDTIASDVGYGKTHYLRMSYGPNPIAGLDYNPIVWGNLSVGVGQTVEIAFAAYADGKWLNTYCNALKASSPDAYIPERTCLAPITIDPPIRNNKTVTPSKVYPGEEVKYDITLLNISLVNESFTLDQVKDDLPTGFYEVGGGNGNIVTINVPNYIIPPGGQWAGSFMARVTTDVDCSQLPRVYANEPGMLQHHYTSPFNGWVANATALAPLTVNPHVLVDLIPQRRTTIPGAVVTYTLSLRNQSPTTLTGAKLVVTLPTDQYYTPTYLRMLQGSSPSVNGQVLTWNGLSLPGSTETLLIFQVQIPGAPTSPVPAPIRALTPIFTAMADNGCIGRLATGGKPNGNGVIVVDPYPIEIYKRALSLLVQPVSLVEYELSLINKDSYPFVIDKITDAMPAGFTYVGMTSGPAPTQTPGSNQLVWTNVTVPAGGTVWRLQLRSAELYGEYINNFSFTDNELTQRPPTLDEIRNRTVSVVPTVSIVKRAWVGVVAPGGTVPYTITLTNLSNVSYTSVRVTDTLPAGFTYLRMVPGGNYPPPSALGAGSSQPVWTNLKLPNGCGTNGCTLVLAFEARVGTGVPPGLYYNNVAADSPSGSIPNLGPSAPVSVTIGGGGGFSHWVYLPVIRR